MKDNKKHSKHYYEIDRNMSTMNHTWEEQVIKDKDNKWGGGSLNPKMMLSKKELGLRGDSRVPDYYKGKNGYEARKVCDNFDLTYHLATATTYILRAYHKHETPTDCIQKAINHLEFELEKIKDEEADF
tara:strand:+ start:3626 stop:4012 length:387 start_codon:yes stop_codon:yes gene_type:complete